MRYNHRLSYNYIEGVIEMIEWAQTLTILGGVAAMWFGCFTILREDIRGMDSRWDKRSTEMEDRWEKRSTEMEARWDKRISESEARWEKSESHWREMFMYMNNKIDDSKKPS